MTLDNWLKAKKVPPVVLEALLVRRSTFAGRDADFEPGEAARALAWRLVLELESRITTQPLGAQVGDEATAAKSVASLFGVVRAESARAGAAAAPTADLAGWMLNAHVREWTARWHGLAEKGLLGRGDHSRRFREELETLQQWLRLWCRLFAVIALDQPWTGDAIVPEDSPRAARSWNARTYPGKPGLRRRELEVLGDLDEAGTRPTAGLAISGGGLRSASFALGVLSGLGGIGTRQQPGGLPVPILDDADYLSTVSGGAYLGTMIATRMAAGKKPLDDSAVEHVRRHSSAMAEGVLSSLVAPWVVGMAATLVPLAVATAALSFAMWVLNALPNGLVAAIALGQLLLGGYLVARDKQQSQWGPMLMAASALVTTLAVSDHVLHRIAAVLPPIQELVPAGLAAAAATFAGLRYQRAGSDLRLLLILSVGALATAVAMLPVFDAWEYVAVLAGVLFVALWSMSRWDPNSLTPRDHYTARLVTTWIPDKAKAPLALDALKGPDSEDIKPIPLWNVAMNLSSPDRDTRGDLHGRTGQLLTFTPQGAECELRDFFDDGSSTTWGTAPVTVREAMALSGAALSPLMGNLTTTASSAWLALLNARMGAWIRNPAKVGPGRNVRPSATLLLREIFGKVDQKSEWTHVSDGGHVENLGVLPLLRRTCRYIVAIDGSWDPDRTFDGLWRLQLRAKLDLGADLDIDTTDLEIDDRGRSNAHAIAIPITYESKERGVLIYIKLSITGDEPQYVSGYRTVHPDFPHQTSADHVYDEAQFEAYRGLGQHIGESLTGPFWLRDGPTVGRMSLQEWVEAVAARMLDQGSTAPWQRLDGD